MIPSIRLNNGVEMPIVGLGTYKAEANQILVEVIRQAIELGYRHIDTASFYGNESSIGEAIKGCDISREELFIVSKVWNDDQGYDKTIVAFEKSLEELGLEYLDLYLIHWPQPIHKETWKALEELYKQGKVRAIGVSNYTIENLEELLQCAEVKPAVNQIEYHPKLVQTELNEYCKAKNITMEAWSPLMRGQLLQDPTLMQIANKYGKTVSQIILRWDIENGVVTIPKTLHFGRLQENIDIFDFSLSKEDMVAIDELNEGMRVGSDPVNVFKDADIIKG